MNQEVKFLSLQDKEIVELQDRFWNRVYIPEDINKCWIWLGTKTTTGYGQLSWLGQFKKAHRVSFWLYKDFCQSWILEFPTILIRHKCNTPLCVNPTHLESGSQKDNMQDRSKIVTHCKYGHEYMKENTYIDNKGRRSCILCRELTSIRRNSGQCINSWE